MSIFSEACYDYVMNEVFSLTFKSWVYSYYHVLTKQYLCEKFIAGSLNFTHFDRHPHERMYWNPKALPAKMLVTPEHSVEFWYGVKYWCEKVLFSRYYDIIFDGPGTGGGVGLSATRSCHAEVIVLKMIGLLEQCTDKQSLTLRDTYRFSSLYQSHENAKRGLVQVLYGPASLLNNDNASPFTFIDKKYLTNRAIKWVVPRQLIVGDNKWEVMFLNNVRGVYLHTTHIDYCFEAGEQIFINYQDPNFIDLTYDTSDEENANRTPARKRLRFQYQHDAISGQVAYGTSSSSSSSSSSSGNSNTFDFGSQSSSLNSSATSDSTYTASDGSIYTVV